MKNRYRYIDTNKEHLHTLDDRPLYGTSTVCGIIGKDGALAWWAAELAAVEALATDQFVPSIREEYAAVKGKRSGSPMYRSSRSSMMFGLPAVWFGRNDCSLNLSPAPKALR